MKKAFAFLIGLLFFSCLVVSCNNKSDKTTEASNTVNKQEFIKIIPKNKNGNLDYAYILTQRLTKESGLRVIENGFDSIFFRLWYVYNGTIQITDFKKQKGIWAAEFHIIQEGIDTVNYVSKFDNIKTSKTSPKSGWVFFINKILSLGIMTLPDDSELPQYNFSSDSFFVVVEIATNTKYRIYTYSDPIFFPEIKETKSMGNIMVLINNEFGIKRLENF